MKPAVVLSILILAQHNGAVLEVLQSAILHNAHSMSDCRPSSSPTSTTDESCCLLMLDEVDIADNVC